jgi:sulfur carrier protein ThiS
VCALEPPAASDGNAIWQDHILEDEDVIQIVKKVG